jgi:hypothetical protein
MTRAEHADVPAGALPADEDPQLRRNAKRAKAHAAAPKLGRLRQLKTYGFCDLASRNPKLHG